MFVTKGTLIKAIREAVYGKDNIEGNLKGEISESKIESMTRKAY